MTAPVKPVSVQIVFEDRILLRIHEESSLIMNYELTNSQLRLLAAQACREALKEKAA